MSETPESASSQEKKIEFSGEQVVKTGVEIRTDLDERAVNGVASQRSTRRSIISRETGIVGLSLACVVLFSLYVRVADYGFYEDDHWGIVPFFKTAPAELWQNTIDIFRSWPTGRPLNHILPEWFSWLGYHLAGVQGIYFLGFLVNSLNAFLVYLLLRRWLGHWAAALGGFLFVLLPIDTTRLLLLHNSHIHTSLTFLLVALIVHRTRYWVVSYPIAALSLLSYETVFLPFIVFPLFLIRGGKRVLQWAIHLAGCGLALLIVFGIRLSLGESRAMSVVSSPDQVLWRMVSSMWIGPKTCLIIIYKALLKAPHAQAPFAFLFAGLVVLLLTLLLKILNEPSRPSAEVLNRPQYLTVFLAGIASWIFAYALTLTNYPPTAETGRLTSTHIAAVFGLACAIAAAISYLRSFGGPVKLAVTAAVAVLVVFLTLYSFRIQTGFAVAWQKERQFWRQVVELCPDLTPNTRVFLVGTEPRQNEFILTNSWADPLVLPHAFDVDGAPFLFYYDGVGALADFRFEDGKVTWKPFFWATEREVLNLDDIIILKDDGEKMSRINELNIPGIPSPLHSKPLSKVQEPLYPAKLTSFGRFLLLQP